MEFRACRYTILLSALRLAPRLMRLRLPTGSQMVSKPRCCFGQTTLHCLTTLRATGQWLTHPETYLNSHKFPAMAMQTVVNVGTLKNVDETRWCFVDRNALQIPQDTKWCTSGFITGGPYNSKVGLNSRERLMDYKGLWYRALEKFIHLINMWNTIDHLDLDKLNSYTWQCLAIPSMNKIKHQVAHLWQTTH